jgi:hypothetical protein
VWGKGLGMGVVIPQTASLKPLHKLPIPTLRSEDASSRPLAPEWFYLPVAGPLHSDDSLVDTELSHVKCIHKS